MTTYVMQARENYTSDISSAFNTLFACPASQILSGLSYDRVRKKIAYCANVVPPANVIGQPTTGSITNPGVGYTPGSYPATDFTGGTGTGGTADITVNGSGNISVCTIDASGSGYLVGDVLSARPSGGLGSGFTFTLSAVSTGAVNSTGHALWSGQTLIPNGASYDGVAYKNHSTMEKNISTDSVTRYDAWSSSNIVPVGLGGKQPLTWTLVAGTGYNNGVTPGVPLLGGSGYGANAIFTVTGGAVTSLQFTNGWGYEIGDVLTVSPDTYLSIGSGTGFSITLTSVTASSDGTWRRVAESQAVATSGYTSPNVIRVVDPRTGNVWGHHQMANQFVSQLYLLRSSANFAQEISPLVPPSPLMGIHPEMQGMTENYLWYLQQQQSTASNTSYLVCTPRDIQAAETAVDYLLPYAWFTWPYEDWTSIAGGVSWASVCCADLSNNLYFLNWNSSSSGVTRTFTILKLTEPTAATPFNMGTVGGSLTDITPWAAGTGPNSGLPANSLFDNWLSDNVLSKGILMYLPTSNNLVAITKIFCVDLGQTWNSTHQANTRFDVTYIDPLLNTFDYHSGWLTGFLDASLNPTVLASAAWALIDMLLVDADLNFHSYDFTSTGVDYSKRWFFLALSPVTGGTWTHPSTIFDPTNRTCLIQVQFVPGSAPTILQTIFDTGWNSAYASFGTTIGNANVVTATAVNSLNSTVYFMLDAGIFDSANLAWWWSGAADGGNMFPLNPSFSGRATPGAGGAQPSPPFLVLSLGSPAPIPTGGGRVRVWGVMPIPGPSPDTEERVIESGDTRVIMSGDIRDIIP